jgi:hypothetical protein
MNAKHQFKYTYADTELEEFSPVDITFDMPGEVTITQMLWNFESYLKACGFVFDGHLEVVPESGYDLEDLEDEIEEEPPYCCMGDTDEGECCEEYKAEKLKEWSEGLAKLEKEVKKNKWVHGMCNPPASDWSNAKNNPDNCWNS